MARGLIALASVDEQERTAARLGGTLALASAALHHGWAVKTVPDRPHVMISRGRRVTKAERRIVHVHRAELGEHEVVDGVTTEVVRLAHCMRRLPCNEALSIADSALRSGVPRSTLGRIAGAARGPGSGQMRRIAEVASPDVANPFEFVHRVLVAVVELARMLKEAQRALTSAA